VLGNLGGIARKQGDYQRAAAYYTKGLALLRETAEYEHLISGSLTGWGYTALNQDDYGQADACFRESMVLFQKHRNKYSIPLNLVGMAAIIGSQQQPERAVQLLGAADALITALAIHLDPAECTDCDRIVAAARAQLGEEAFAAAWEAGRAMTLEQAIAEALGQ
jgi:tetratricopeptide (TPR) repeat protein